ncbi:hypothetical protein ABKV19_020252 [Rosa sericea]
MNFISKDCYNESGYNVESNVPWLRWNRPFSISGSKKRFVAVGCDTSAVLQGFRGEEEFMIGCTSVCLNISSEDQNSCSGVGCCRAKISEGLKNRTVTLLSYYNHTDIWKFNPCSYAFLVRDGYFNFSGKRSFEEAQEHGSDADDRYEGNPYIGCREELKKATKDYDENEKIGEGGYGTVYKGVLEDKRVVAIKMSKMTTQVRSDQFINELIVLSQIRQRNVVRLLGCCLETKTPLLVYEYVGNGTLYDHIHKKNGEPLSFAQRLKIATETAKALSHLHSSAIHRIIHRDVKATNILLDEKLTVKVTDFGASKLVPDDKTVVSTLVQGTMGYLDPEYLRSNTLTEKSDVYSFGVVLVELLTGENAVRFDKPEEERNLANVFVSTINKGPLHPILDGEIVKDGNWEIIERVAKLAEECLSVKGDERPPMEVVERELDEILKTLEKQPGGKKLRASSSKETGHSLESLSNTRIVEVSGEDDGGSTGIISSAEYDASMQNQAQKPFHDGR